MTSYAQAFDLSHAYFNNKLAAKVYVDKYALRTPQGDILEPTPDLMHRRLAKEFARIEAKYPNPLSEDEIFGYLDQFRYIIPQGSPMAGIGNKFAKVSLSNCFVLRSPFDSMSGIGTTVIEEKEIMKRRGGVGFDISNIRPKGLPTSNAAGSTDGIEVFMEEFSDACRRTAQHGRRGALMITISVHHPEIKTFLHSKEDLKKVTGANISIRLSDEFMNAVKNGEGFQLRFPVDSPNPTVSETIDARTLWDEIIGAAYKSAEPGLLFWDTIMKYCPANCYPNFITISTNPCFSGDTLIAVADGRNAVCIKQLAEEGKDVPVYSVNPVSGMVNIKMARNPRITGFNRKLVRVTLDDGSHFDVTPDHKCLLLDGSVVLAKNLLNGASLPRFLKERKPVKTGGKDYWLLHSNTKNMMDNRIFEHRLIANYFNPVKWAEIYGNAKAGGWAKTGGLVVHHKDYDGLNNTPENLEIMTFKDHQNFHAQHDNVGENNNRYLGVTNAQVKEHALELTRNLNRRFSSNEWLVYALANKLPQNFSMWRQKGFYTSPTMMAKSCANELGLENGNLDPRLTKTLASMLEQGYEAKIIGNQVMVQKTCETCCSLFEIEHNRREISFCSQTCSLVYVNNSKEIAVKRSFARNKEAMEKSTINRQNQSRIFSALKFTLSREPTMKEWEQACKIENVPSRVGKMLKYGFQNFQQVKKAGNAYNHKVVSVVELEGEHNVYNITVDDNHTLATITNANERKMDGVFVFNCGELTLSAYDSCRLLLVNALSFIRNAFTSDACVDWALFNKIAMIAQRLMDDLVDLEIECVDGILAKIHSDPEPEEIKAIELTLWNRIREACVNGRRTGLGLTGVGDMVATMNMRYGSPESIALVEKLYKELALASYASSIELAKERGTFPAFSYDLEKDHPFLNRIWDASPELYQEYIKFGRRNIANLTTPPAGSTSILAKSVEGFGVTSGIENVLFIRAIRRKKINPTDKDARVDFVDDMGDKWTEFFVYHPGFEAWKHITSKTDNDVQASPYWNSTADDVDWSAKVDMQAVAQKWVDHSISNTTNLPEDVSIETVKDVYMRGWGQGCKGVTIYRKNSRAGVVLSEKDKLSKKVDFEEHHAPKRSKELECDVYHSTIQGEKWTIFIGKLNGKPYELMGGLAKYVNLPKRVRSGMIVKHNGEINPARYDFHYDYDKGPEDEAIIKDMGNVFENPVNAAFTRTISLSLRHGVPVQYICEQLLKGAEKESDLFSFSKVMSRVLKNYIQDGTKTAQKTCPECKSVNLAYQQGCVACTDCGYSKCN